MTRTTENTKLIEAEIRRLSGVTGYALDPDYAAEMVHACLGFATVEALRGAVDDWRTWERLPKVADALNAARGPVKPHAEPECHLCQGAGWVMVPIRRYGRKSTGAERCQCSAKGRRDYSEKLELQMEDAF